MIDKSLGSRLFDGINALLLLILALVTFIPFIHIISSSFASTELYNRTDFLLFPTEFSLKAYDYIFTTNALPRSLLITVGITVFGTLLNLIITSLMAYSLSRRNLHPGFPKTHNEERVNPHKH